MSAPVDLAALHTSLAMHVDLIAPLPADVELGECGADLCTDDRRRGWESDLAVARILLNGRVFEDVCLVDLDSEVSWLAHHTRGEITVLGPWVGADIAGAVA